MTGRQDDLLATCHAAAAAAESVSKKLSVPLLPLHSLGSDVLRRDRDTWGGSGTYPWQDQPAQRRRSIDSSFSADYPERRMALLGPGLHFTPVNSSHENFVPASHFNPHPPRAPHSQSFRGGRSQSKCRLIGFTPLSEEVPTASVSDSAPFLGPPQVKAKEVAPCALFYERADVFVSVEMKQASVLACCERHYHSVCFDDEISVKELEFADLPGLGADYLGPAGAGGGARRGTAPETGTGQQVGLVLSQLFATDGLQTIPLDALTEESDSAPRADSGGEALAHWSTFDEGEGERTSPSASSVASSNLHSRLWDPPTTSSTRAASPVSSVYSNISSSCQHGALTSLLPSVQHAPCGFAPSLAADAERRGYSQSASGWTQAEGPAPRAGLTVSQMDYFSQRHVHQAEWHEDRESWADDEEDSEDLEDVECASLEQRQPDNGHSAAARSAAYKQIIAGLSHQTGLYEDKKSTAAGNE